MKQTQSQVIGPKTLLDFIDLELLAVPAKVDTGADSSSLWASEIKENKGELSFVLFGPASPWYNGKLIRIREYSIKSIKNSFGNSEFRYKVPLTIRLGGRKIRARFTLSNRSNNRYPVLIGRQTLKNKFIVDVARLPSRNKSTRVLVLSHTNSEKIRTTFSKLSASSKGLLVVDTAKYSDLMISADETSVSIMLLDHDLKDYDLIYFLTRVKDSELAAIVAAYAKLRGTAFADQAAALLATNTKAHQAMLLAGHVRQPRTLYYDREAWQASYNKVVRSIGLPFVFKDNNGL